MPSGSVNWKPVSDGGFAVSAAIWVASGEKSCVKSAGQIRCQLLEPGVCRGVGLRLIAVEAAGPLIGDD